MVLPIFMSLCFHEGEGERERERERERARFVEIRKCVSKLTLSSDLQLNVLIR
jgi:hypothetical protein